MKLSSAQFSVIIGHNETGASWLTMFTRTKGNSENQRFRQSMMPTSSRDYLCPCGRSFQQDSALTKHQRTCSKTKKRLSSALETAKEVWRDKKRRRTSSTLTGCSEDVAETQLPGLLPTPAVADATESFAEVRDTLILLSYWRRLLRACNIVAYGTRWYRRFTSHHDGPATMGSANQP